MTKRNRQPSTRRFFEQLEDRCLLAVTATVIDGDLRIEGVADGPIAIVATGASTIQVTDNGNVVATAEGVKDDIFVRLDAKGESTNDQISMKLDGATIDRVVVNAGDGDNSIRLENGSIAGSLSVIAGNGDDTLTVDASVKIARSLFAKLGDGNNALLMSGSVSQSLIYDGGLDDDTLTLLAGSVVGRSVAVSLGNGVNQVNLDGTVEGSVGVRGIAGDDSVSVGTEGIISGSLVANLGSGTNSVTHSGEITGDLRVRTETATDKVTVDDTAIVGGANVTELGVSKHGHRGQRGRLGGRFR